GKYVTEEKPDYFITREEGEPDIIEQEVRKLKDFLFADESTFSDEKYKTYQKFTNDRIMRQVSAMAKRFIVKGQSKAMRAALQGNSVLSFLNSIGIIVEYESDVVSNEKRSL
ncbi:MAG: hypothetical protein NTV63_04505, partial [Candidatus Woesearchaeota archaeon]|nr:hypothetical protein [Candidatus Woesearchaeota archaeon]